MGVGGKVSFNYRVGRERKKNSVCQRPGTRNGLKGKLRMRN